MAALLILAGHHDEARATSRIARVHLRTAVVAREQSSRSAIDGDVNPVQPRDILIFRPAKLDIIEDVPATLARWHEDVGGCTTLTSGLWSSSARHSGGPHSV